MNPVSAYQELKDIFEKNANLEIENHKKGFYYYSKEILDLKNFSDQSFPEEYINVKEERYKVTLLHIAVMSSNYIAIKTLLKQNFDPNLQDHRGWTPLHHAAIQFNSIYTLLKSNGADSQIRNDLFATASKLKKLLTIQKGNKETIPCRISNKSPLMTPKDYLEMTQSHYINENFVEREYLIKEWHQAKKPLECLFPFTNEISQEYKSYRKQPPIHILKKVTRDSSNTLLKKIQLGLFSHETFPKHKIVGEYLGHISILNMEGNYILSNGCDAHMYSHPSTRINHSFPNVAMMRLPASGGVEGLEYRYVFVSLEKVNGQFCCNYVGHQPIEFGPYHELRPKEMREFIQTNDIEDLINCFLMDTTNQCYDWTTYKKSEQLRYILQTPSALFLLAIEGMISYDNAVNLVNIAIHSKVLVENEETKKMIPIAILLNEIRNSLFQKNALICEDFENFFSRLISTVSLKEVLIKAKYVLENFQLNAFYSLSWKSIKEILLPKQNNILRGLFCLNQNFSFMAKKPKILDKDLSSKRSEEFERS